MESWKLRLAFADCGRRTVQTAGELTKSRSLTAFGMTRGEWQAGASTYFLFVGFDGLEE
jgi:hypothetical protein